MSKPIAAQVRTVCCGETNYCARIEIYCGSRQNSRYVDTMSGSAAVLRNLRAIWPLSKIDRSQMRVVVAIRLYEMGFCSIGTVTPSRRGFLTSLKYPFKTVPKRLADQRGLCRLQRYNDASNSYICMNACGRGHSLV